MTISCPISVVRFYIYCKVKDNFQGCDTTKLETLLMRENCYANKMPRNYNHFMHTHIPAPPHTPREQQPAQICENVQCQNCFEAQQEGSQIWRKQQMFSMLTSVRLLAVCHYDRSMTWGILWHSH